MSDINDHTLIPDKFKRCTKCKCIQSQEEFVGASSWCNACHAAFSREWRRSNRSRSRDLSASYYEKNREAVIKRNNERRRNKYEKPLQYFDHRCAVCGKPQGLWHTIAGDHWIPKSKGGSDLLDNIVPLCHGQWGCNNIKGRRDPHEWLVETYGARKAKKIEARINAYFEWVRQQDNKSA